MTDQNNPPAPVAVSPEATESPMQKSMATLFSELDEATLRMDRIICLAGALAGGDAFPDDLDEFFDDEDETDIEKCLGPIPEWVDIGDSRSIRNDEICEWLVGARKFGFLIHFATPVMKKIAEGCRSFSWGYYNTSWIYAETMEEAVAKAIAWAGERRAAEQAKAEAPQ